jgi:membrane protein implicated in regulation of membrane protease activity
MLFKFGLKIAVLALEIFLAVYSMVISDSLLVKFLFFAFSAVIIAFIVTKMTSKLLPSDKDHVSRDQEQDFR